MGSGMVDMTPEELEDAKWAAHEKECESAALAYLKEQKRLRLMRRQSAKVAQRAIRHDPDL